jgi:hypothetical protein
MSLSNEPQFRQGLLAADQLSSRLASTRADTVGMMLCGNLWSGMSQDLVRLSLGEPTDTSSSGTGDQIRTEWQYQSNGPSMGAVRVSFDRGRVSDLQVGVAPAIARLAQDRLARMRRLKEDSVLRTRVDSLREMAHEAADCRPSRELLIALANLWQTVGHESLVRAACGKAFIGMDASLLDLVRSGERPSRVNTTRTAAGIEQQFVYDPNQYHSNAVYVYVSGGRVTAIQE